MPSYFDLPSQSQPFKINISAWNVTCHFLHSQPRISPASSHCRNLSRIAPSVCTLQHYFVSYGPPLFFSFPFQTYVVGQSRATTPVQQVSAQAQKKSSRQNLSLQIWRTSPYKVRVTSFLNLGTRSDVSIQSYKYSGLWKGKSSAIWIGKVGRKSVKDFLFSPPCTCIGAGRGLKERQLYTANLQCVCTHTPSPGS